MKTINTRLTNEQANKELRRFSPLSLIAGIVGLFIFWWLGIVAFGFGVRAIILSRHVGNQDSSKKYLTFAVIGSILGLVDVVFYYIV